MERRADREDGRAALLTTTPLGEETFETHRRRRTAALDALTAHWPSEDVRTLSDLLDRFTTELERFPGLAGTTTPPRPPEGPTS